MEKYIKYFLVPLSLSFMIMVFVTAETETAAEQYEHEGEDERDERREQRHPELRRGHGKDGGVFFGRTPKDEKGVRDRPEAAG